MSAYKSSRDLANKVRAKISYDTTQKMIAAEFGVSQAYLSDFLAGRREAGPKILKALGYEPTPFYRTASKSGTA